MDLGGVVKSLGRETTLLVDSSPALAAEVHRRAKKAARSNEAYSYRKKPKVMPYAHCPRTSPAQVLHELGVATTYFNQPPFAEIARHWAQVRYCATLVPNGHDQLALSRDADEAVYHHKVTQSEQIGVGLALVVAKDALRRKYGGWEFSAVDAELALRAGFVEGLGPVRQAGRSKKRPDYFLVGRRTDGGAGFKVVVLECKGTHSKAAFAYTQLATACVQVETVEVGGSTPPGLMVASRLSRSEIVSYLLDPDGDDDLWSGTDEETDELLAATPEDAELTLSAPTADQRDNRRRELDDDPVNGELFSADRLDAAGWEPEWESDGEPFEQIEPGTPHIFRIPPDRRRWFAGVLARTAAATALLFAGDGEHANRYATPRQRQRPEPRPDGLPPEEDPVPGSTATSTFTLAGGLDFRGTQYQAPLSDGRVLEIHKGVEEGLHGLLTDGQVGPAGPASVNASPRPSGAIEGRKNRRIRLAHWRGREVVPTGRGRRGRRAGSGRRVHMPRR